MLNLFDKDIKRYHLFLSLLVMGLVFACTNPGKKDKHPQAKMGSGTPAFVDESSIIGYADSIKLNLSQYEKRESLVFTKEDHSFYVTRYSSTGKPVLYIEHGSGEIGSVEKYYYVNGKQLLLFREDIFNSYRSPRYRSFREFYRNNVLFYSDEKYADNSAAFDAAKYEKADSVKRNGSDILAHLESAINAEGEFSVTFEGITEYPKARYIILSKNELKSYRAVIRVENEDDFIRELVNNTGKYKGTSLNIDWEIRDGEAFYLRGAFK